MTKPKRKKRDPLAALKRKHPGKWRVVSYMADWEVRDSNNNTVAFVPAGSRTLARAIAKLGAK